jgi:predicted  nucleic acid-binding Zn-ribbon protein
MSSTDGLHYGEGGSALVSGPADAGATIVPGATPAGMSATEADGQPSPLALLLAVQALDLAADQLSYRRRELPERAELARLDSTLAGLLGRLAELQAQHDEMAANQERLDHQVDMLTSRMAAIEARLNSGGAASFRDQEAMANESASLARQRRLLEDQELEIMEALEPVDAELAAVRTQLDAEEEARSVATAALEASEVALDGERSVVAAERQSLAAGLPPDLAAVYERLRAKLGGVGAAKLVDGTCSGCHLKLPARERDQIQHSAEGTIFYCEQCGRILVP